MMFEISYPTGYQIRDIYNDNIDLNIILDSGDIYFGTMFTLKNIEELMKSNPEDSYFWSVDMCILDNLSEESIRKAVSNIIKEGIINNIFSKING